MNVKKIDRKFVNRNGWYIHIDHELTANCTYDFNCGDLPGVRVTYVYGEYTTDILENLDAKDALDMSDRDDIYDALSDEPELGVHGILWNEENHPTKVSRPHINGF